jgi:lambda family phage portal protein
MIALRDRARDLVRNNAYAARAIDVKGSNTIGVGITAEVKNRKLAKRWETFAQTCDADGKLDLYGLQSLVERCRMESGEVLIRRVPSQMVTGGVAMKLRVLEPDYIDNARDGVSAETGNQIRGGIEYDAFGTPLAYYLHRQHPGDSWATAAYRRDTTSVRVDADEIIHVFRKQRAGQTRGVTDFAPVMLRMRDLDDYDDAEVMRKKIEACLAAFVTSPASLDATALGTLSTDDTGRG